MPTIPIRWADNTKELATNLKEGLNQIEATKAAAEKMVKSLAGENLIRAAHNYVAAVQQIGGATKLTAEKSEQVNAILKKAIAQYDALGKQAPAAMRALEQATRQVEKPTEGLTTRMVALGAAIGTFLGNFAYDALKRIGASLLDIASNGVKLAPTVSAFNSLTRAVGESGDAMLKAARTGTKGLISDLELMQAANKGLLLGLPITAQSFGLLSQTAVVLGKAMGQGPVKSFDDLITALGRSSPMILDNLGLSVKVGEANERYAKSVGKTADQLTAAEQKLAFYNAAMDAAKQKVEEVGGLNLTLADRVQQAQVAFKNFTDALGVAIATSPVINSAFGSISDSISAAFGENQTVLVQRLSRVINTLAIGVVDTAQIAVTAAGLMSRVWSGLQFVFSGVASVVTSLGLAFYNLIAGTYEVAQRIPGLGEKFAAAARSARDMATWMGGVQQSFHDQASEALRGIAGNSAYQQTLDKLSGSLSEMRGRMVAASKTQVDAAVIAEQLTATQNDTAESTKTLTKEQEALRDAWKSYNSTGTSFIQTLQMMNGVAVEAIKADLAAGKSKKDLALIYEVTDGQIDAVAESLKFENDVAALSERIHVGLGSELKNVGAVAVELGARAVPQLSVAFAAAASAAGNLATRGSALASSLKSAFQQLPDLIVKGLTGGGGVTGALKAFASQIGNAFTNSVAGSITKNIGGALGSILGGIVGPLGSLLGPALGKIGSWIGGLFGNNEEKKINPIRQAYIDAAGGLEELNRRAHEAGVTLDKLLDAKNPKQYEAAIRDLNDALQFQSDAMATLDETVKKYGFTIEELGPALARQNLDKQAQELYKDFKVLTSAGIDIDTVLKRMGGSMNQFVQDAIKSGTEIPAAMAPMIQRMVELGQLTDENGNVITDLEQAGVHFSMTMTEGFQSIVKVVEKLTDAITRGLGLAIQNIPQPEVTGRVRWEYDDPNNYQMMEQPSYGSRGGRVTSGGIQYFVNGGPVLRVPQFRAIGRDTVPAMLRPGELVLTPEHQAMIGALLASAGSAAPGSSGSAALATSAGAIDGGDINITLTVDGHELADVVVTRAERDKRGIGTRLRNAVAS